MSLCLREQERKVIEGLGGGGWHSGSARIGTGS